MSISSSETTWDRRKTRAQLGILFLVVFIDLLGFGIIMPVLPLYAERYGANGTQIGLITSLYAIMQFIFTPLWGAWSDRVGRRPIILISISGSVLSLVLLGWSTFLGSTTIMGWSTGLWGLFAARALGGISAGNISAAQAYVADITPQAHRARGMGMIGAAFGLGFVFGPAICALLSPPYHAFPSWLAAPLSHYGYAVAPWFAAGLAVLNLLLAFFRLPESLPRGATRRRRANWLSNLQQALQRPHMGLLFAVLFFGTLAFTSMYGVFSLVTERLFRFHERENGYLFAYIGLLGVLFQGVLLGPLVKRWGEAVLVVAGNLLLVFGLGLIPFAPTVAALAVVLLALAAGSAFTTSPVSGLVSRFTSPEDQGTVLGASQSLNSLARAIGPFWGGWMFDHDFHAPFVGGAILVAAVFVLSLGLLRLPAANAVGSR